MLKGESIAGHVVKCCQLADDTLFLICFIFFYKSHSFLEGNIPKEIQGIPVKQEAHYSVVNICFNQSERITSNFLHLIPKNKHHFDFMAYGRSVS